MKAGPRLLIAALVCSAALAQTPGPVPGAAAPPASGAQGGGTPLSPKSENGVAYLCGGIGEAEAAQMKREAANYNLMLSFAESDGAYLADVTVDIDDARGMPVLQTVCDAPIMLLNLPKAGSYRITAEVGGQAVSKTVRARPGRRTAAGLTWPSQNAQGALNR